MSARVRHFEVSAYFCAIFKRSGFLVLFSCFPPFSYRFYARRVWGVIYLQPRTTQPRGHFRAWPVRRGDWCYALLTLVLSRFVFLLAFIFAFFCFPLRETFPVWKLLYQCLTGSRPLLSRSAPNLCRASHSFVSYSYVLPPFFV